MFKYNEDEERYLAVVDGVEFASEEEPELSDEEVRSLAERYQENLPSILDFMLPALPKALGRPRIDLDASEVSYCGHTLDETHIISFEFYDGFETLENLAIDG